MPRARSHLLIDGALTLVAMLAWTLSSAGQIVEREFDSGTLGRPWRYNVYLPSGYEDSQAQYPVLYLLHGNGQNFASWASGGNIEATADALIAAHDIPPTVIVMPDAGTTWYVDRKEPMESAILRDLIPDVEAHYRVRAERSGRLIAGLSMGGYGSMRFALKYPELFAAAALLSPAIYDPDPPQNSSARRVDVFGSPDFDAQVWRSLGYPALWDAFLAKRQPVPMYIVTGDDDEFYIESSATQFYSLLRKHNQPAELRIVDGKHDWQVWRNVIGDAMKYLFRYTTQSAPPVAEH